MITPRRRFGTVAVAAAATVALVAACGSSKTTSSASTTPPASGSSPTASATGTTATGSPIVIYDITDIGGMTGSFPGIPAAEKAAIRDVNANGGVNGHPLQLQTCNGQADPNEEVTCARNAASSSAVAVVGSVLTANPGGALAVLQPAGLADLAGLATSPNELASPIAFPVDAGNFVSDGCLALVKAGKASKLAIVVSDFAAIEAGAKLFAQSAQADGVTVTTTVTLPANSPDVSSQVQQLINSKADEIAINTFPVQAPQVLQAAAQLGATPAFCGADGLLGATALSGLGAAASNVYLTASMPPLSAASSNPAVAKFISDEAAELASGDKDATTDAKDYNSTSLRAWAGVQAFVQVAKSITGPITKASFLAAIRKSDSVTTGIFPPIDFTKPAVKNPAFPSLYNTSVDLEKWDASKKEIVTSGLPNFDIAPLLGG